MRNELFWEDIREAAIVVFGTLMGTTALASMICKSYPGLAIIAGSMVSVGFGINTFRHRQKRIDQRIKERVGAIKQQLAEYEVEHERV